MPGEIVHTNDVKVHLGAGFWADLTARQAAAFVDRKRGGAFGLSQAVFELFDLHKGAQGR